jgi:hypothetical protein
VRRARTNFNALELMCSMPDDAQVIMDAMREGRGQREAARQHMGGGGLISQVVANALGQLPSMVDSSTTEGALTPSIYIFTYVYTYVSFLCRRSVTCHLWRRDLLSLTTCKCAF